MLKNQHESWVNYYFQPYLSSQLIFIEVILASMKGQRQWPLSLCWGSGSGIYFLLSSFLLLLIPGQSSLFMDFRVFVQVDGFATVENSLHASLFAVFSFTAVMYFSLTAACRCSVLSHVITGKLNTAEKGGGGGAQCACMTGTVFMLVSIQYQYQRWYRYYRYLDRSTHLYHDDKLLYL